MGLAADIAHFDVFHAIGYESYWALENIHSGLVRVDPQGNIIPDMATSWDVKDEGRTYIFHLHKGIIFHEGTLKIRLKEPSADFLMALAGIAWRRSWPPRPRCNSGGRIINFIQSAPDRLSSWNGRLGNRSSWRKTSTTSSQGYRISTALSSRR